MRAKYLNSEKECKMTENYYKSERRLVALFVKRDIQKQKESDVTRELFPEEKKVWKEKLEVATTRTNTIKTNCITELLTKQ
jgi:hypothetical protein